MNIDFIRDDMGRIDRFFRRLIAERNYSVTESSVSWDDYKPGIGKRFFYLNYFQALVDSRQYSYLLIDGSVVQIYFDFKEGILNKSKMAFFPRPVVVRGDMKEVEDGFLAYGDEYVLDCFLGAADSESCADLGFEFTNSSHIRIDYDADVASHSKSHFQFGGINELRIDIDKIVTPLVFFDFIISGIDREFRGELQKDAGFVAEMVQSKKGLSKVAAYKGSGVYATAL
ncbi:MAG: DUF2290 domain-containing protein [Halothiobacillaceae bacterium]